MSHPLDEMTPVLLKIPGVFCINPSNIDFLDVYGSSARMCFANDEDQKIVGVVDNLGLVITLNKKSGLHSIWSLEKAQVEVGIYVTFCE